MGLHKIVIVSLALFAAATSREIVIGNGEYVFDWTVEGDYITITATAATTGYIGFGLSPLGDMIGADLFIGGVDDEGNSYYGVLRDVQ